MTKGRKFTGTDRCAIGRNVGGIEADTAEETFQSGVAMKEEFLAIEAASNLVDKTGREGVGIRQRNRMIAPITLCETQAGIFGGSSRNRSSCAGLRGNVVDAIEMVILAEIMIEAQGSGVGHRAGRQNGVVSAD